jgi:hypothetical protein
MTRGFVMGLILVGFIAFWVFAFIYWILDFSKRMTKKQGRSEIKSELKSTVKFIATDADFHKGLRKDFRGEIIIFSILALMFVVALIKNGL